MLTKIHKWGNSLALRIPKAFADSLDLGDGTHVNLILAEDRLVVSPLPAYLSVDEFEVTVSRDEIEQWKASTWQLSAHLNVPALKARGIQWALFDQDPMPKFLGGLSRRFPPDSEDHIANSRASATQVSQVSLAMVTWNILFRSIPGDQVGTLDHISGQGAIYASAANEGPAWFVTKPSRIEDRVLAWCIPLERSIGERTVVDLTVENAADLTSIVREVVA